MRLISFLSSSLILNALDIFLIGQVSFNMPGEVIDRPNPQPLPSHIPDVVEQLDIKLQQVTLDQETFDALYKFRRAACFIAAGKPSVRCTQFTAKCQQE